MANSPLGTVLNRLRTILEPADVDATDRELLHRFVAQREEAAFSELVRRHGPMVLGVCRRLLGDAHAAEDAFQATFLVLVRRARAVPWRESLGGWLHGAAWRVALRAKKVGAASRAGLVRLGSPQLHSPDPSEEAAARELRRVLDQELQGLPAKYRAPLVLCDLEGKTHEQAARELGWPKGSLAKRLDGGRERLRARLVRRGVALSAAALAALVTKEATASVPTASLAAAALLAADGGASTAAAALAKGVVQAMWLTKMLTAAVLVLALTAVGGVVGVKAIQNWQAQAAPAPSSPAPADEKEIMPIDKAVVYRIGQSQGPAGPFVPLSEGAVVVGDRGDGADANVLLFNIALARSKKEDLTVPSGPNLALLAAGPVLVSPDDAAVVGLTRSGDNLDLQLAYTSAVASGKMRKTDEPWRPLVQVPVVLGPGRYKLTVTWQARKSLPAGEAWKVAPTVTKCEFAVLPFVRQESKPVRISGAEFTALAPARCVAPPAGAARDVEFALRIANVSDKREVFNLLETVRLSLTTADGMALKWNYDPNAVRAEDGAAVLDAGRDATVRRKARLEWSGDGKTMRLGGTDARGDWWFEGLRPGKYRLSFTFENDDEGKDQAQPFWVGKATTEEVEFKILDGSNWSKPVRVDGLEFMAFAPIRVAAPNKAAEDAAVPVDLSLRVTNVSDRPLSLWVNDSLNLRLSTPEGKEPLKPDVGRDGTPKAKPPVKLAPGDSWTFRLDARLQVAADGAKLVLWGPDGHGVGGFWSFGKLHPGKYSLIVGYSNSVAKQDDTSLWTGSAQADPVDFEITAP
jgi:RNA polymerase sigma factor (sigma-70 family)